jgi:hypothetical protein
VGTESTCSEYALVAGICEDGNEPGEWLHQLLKDSFLRRKLPNTCQINSDCSVLLYQAISLGIPVDIVKIYKNNEVKRMLNWSRWLHEVRHEILCSLKHWSPLQKVPRTGLTAESVEEEGRGQFGATVPPSARNYGLRTLVRTAGVPTDMETDWVPKKKSEAKVLGLLWTTEHGSREGSSPPTILMLIIIIIM